MGFPFLLTLLLIGVPYCLVLLECISHLALVAMGGLVASEVLLR